MVFPVPYPLYIIFFQGIQAQTPQFSSKAAATVDGDLGAPPEDAVCRQFTHLLPQQTGGCVAVDQISVLIVDLIRVMAAGQEIRQLVLL